MVGDRGARLGQALGAIRRAPPALVGRGTVAWLLSAALLAASFVVTLGAQRQADAARRAYGGGAEVWVVQRPVAAGATVQAGDALAQRLPLALLPEGAVTTEEDVVGRRALVALVDGEVVLRPRLGDGSGASSREDGRLAVAVAAELAPADARVGDRVVLLAPAPEPGAASGSALSIEATVVGLEADAGRLVVSVDALDAERLVVPLLRDELLISLAGPGP